MKHRIMFTSRHWTDDSKLLQDSNLTARQPHRAPHHVIQATTSEGLAKGGVDLGTFLTEGTLHHDSSTTLNP